MPFADEPFAERVEVVPFDPGWAAEAAAYVDLLGEIVPGAQAVDHIGSTSVPGLPAKDCLDLMVRVGELDEDDVVPALAAHGFRVRPEPWNRQEVTGGTTHRKLVFAGPFGSRLVNVHVRIAGGRNVRYALLFRDFLRADADAREAWGAFKAQLARTVTNLMDYGQIKAAAQPLLMQGAERWAAQTRWTVASSAPSEAHDGPSGGNSGGWLGP
jgi:GrpB-like predicted nucleotidyltransferase (UPF0157 family)